MIMPRFWFKHRSVIFTWLLSYLGILMMPILISIVVNHESQKMLESEIHRANDALLEEVRVIIDSQFDNVVRLTSELMWNPSIRAFMYSNYYKTNEFRYDLYITAKNMGLYQSLYPFVKNYYVFWREGDIVLLPGVYRDSKLAYNTINESGNISYDLWMELLNSKHEGRFLKIKGNDSELDTLAYIHSFKGENTERPPGTIVVDLDTAKLLDVIRNVQDFSGGEVMILDDTNRVLLSSSEENTDPILLSNRFADKKGSFFEEYRGQKSEFFYIKSKYSSISFVTVVPSKLFWEKARYVNNLTYMALLISVVGGLLLTIYLLRKNYNPVSRLLHALKGQTKGMADKVGNEFSYIHAVISNAMSEKEQIQYKMKQQTYMLRSNMLSKLLKGHSGHQLPLEESLTAFNIDFKSDRFAVMLFYVQDYDAFFEHVQGEESLDKLKLMHFIMTNIVEELANHKHGGVMAEVDDCMACLINLVSTGETTDTDELRRLAARAQQFMLDNFRINTAISISGVKITETGIAEAYKEALDAMEYIFVVGEREIITFEDIQPAQQTPLQISYYYPMQIEQQLINHVRAGDYDKVETIVRVIIEKNVSHPKVSVGLVKCLMFNLVGTLINTLNEIGDLQESVMLDLSNKLNDLILCESVKEMEQRFSSVLSEVCSYKASRRKNQLLSERSVILQERSEDIVEYINKSYSDPNLNITMIGEQFGMTQTYLSKLFKEQTGNGILDTINQVRVGKAKQLLGENKKSIKTIAGIVGFHDVNTFIRVFKKYEGVTPGQYQKMV